MRAIDPAMGATAGDDVLSDAAIESLLAGLNRTPPRQRYAAAPTSPADGPIETGLQEFAAALQARFDQAAIPLVVESGRALCAEPLALAGTPLRRMLESAGSPELICTRELLLCMVDYRFGGPGVAALANPLRPLCVTERRSLDSLLDSVRQVWHSNGATLEKAAPEWFTQHSSAPDKSLTLAFSVRAGAGAGTLALVLNVPGRQPQPSVTSAAESLTLIGELARIRLPAEAAQSLSVGDIIAFTLSQPVEVICAGVKLRCAHGASAGRHALRVLAVSAAEAAADPEPTEEIEYSLELGRRQLSREALQAIDVGDLILFDQAVDAPLPLTSQQRCCGYAEVVVLPDGHAMRIVEWES